MKSKPFLFIASALLALFIVTAACSTGFSIGRSSNPTPVEPASPAAPAQEAVATPDRENESQGAVEEPQQVRPQTTLPSRPATQPSEPVDREELFEAFWQAWDIIHEQYVDQPLDDEALMRGALSGMLEALGDQHTSYMDPDQFRQSTIPLEQEYDGIGAWVDTSAEFLTIVSPMPGSPAEEAGLKPGDKVIMIDGEDMTGIDGSLVIRRVLGPAGSSVTLTIRRDGPAGSEPEIFDVSIVRGRITIPSVDYEMLDGNIAYVQLFQFGDNSRDELRKALTELMAQNPSGLILDLRNNGGGWLTAAVEVSSEFISSGVILYEDYGDGTRDTYNALRGGLATEIPLVVLVNEGTASASEILAGAVQDYGRGTLVGTTTFGKGSVQQLIPLRDNQGAVRVTIARWLTPEERQIHGIGLEPDVVVEITEEDIAEERDPQLDKAVEILTTQ